MNACNMSRLFAIVFGVKFIATKFSVWFFNFRCAQHYFIFICFLFLSVSFSFYCMVMVSLFDGKSLNGKHFAGEYVSVVYHSIS